MTNLDEFIDQKVDDIGQLTPFLGQAYRIKSEKLTALPENERNIFWQKNIWEKFHRRVNKNLGNFAVIEYQGYFYLTKKAKINMNSSLSDSIEYSVCFSRCDICIN